MKTKGRRQSKNIERGKDATKNEIAAHEMFDWDGDPPQVPDSYMRIAKQQAQNAIARGRRMGLSDQHDAIASGKFGKNSSLIEKKGRHGKHGRNPFEKARSK